MDIIDESLDLELPEVIIFDWDNTLVDAWPLIHDALCSALKKFGHQEWTLEETKIKVHRSLREMLPKIFPENWQEVGDHYRDAYIKNMHKIKPLQDSEEVLQTLNNANIKVALISNKKGELLRKEIQLLEWDKYFQSVMGSGDLDVDKPNPKTVQITLEKLAMANASKVWFIGDSVSDMELAYASDSLPVYYGPEDFKNSRYEHCKPKVHIKNYKTLKRFIEGKHARNKTF